MDFLKITGAIVGIVVAVFGFVFYISSHVCYSSFAEYNPQWGVWSGCRIEWQGKMTPTDMIKNINLK